MKFIIGKKLNMTQLWQGEEVAGVTKVQIGPCVVSEIKTIDRDGYGAIQLGFGEKKSKNIRKPQQGNFNKILKNNPKAKVNFSSLKEFRVTGEEAKSLEIGDVIDASTFSVGDIVKVTGVSKGKGFQGVVRRHGFHGQNRTHGNKDQHRMPGSIGNQAAQHVLKGKRMAGHMGDEQVTTSNLKIVQVDEDNNLLYIRGSVPGAINGLVFITAPGELKFKKPSAATVAEVKEPVIEINENNGEDIVGPSAEEILDKTE